MKKEDFKDLYYRHIMGQYFGGPGSGRHPEGGDSGSGEGDGSRSGSLQTELDGVDDELKKIDKEDKDEEINKWADHLENEYGLKGNKKDRAARKIAEKDRSERKKNLEKKKKQLQDDLETEKWADDLERELGVSKGKILPKIGLIN